MKKKDIINLNKIIKKQPVPLTSEEKKEFLDLKKSLCVNGNLSDIEDMRFGELLEKDLGYKLYKSNQVEFN